MTRVKGLLLGGALLVAIVSVWGVALAAGAARPAEVSHAALQQELLSIEQPEDAVLVAPLSRGRRLADGEVVSFFYTSRWPAARLRAYFDTALRRHGWRPSATDPAQLAGDHDPTLSNTYCKPGYQARFTPAGASATGTWRYAISLTSRHPSSPCPEPLVTGQ